MRRHRVEAEIHLSLRRVVLVGSLWITSLTVLLAMALLTQDPVPWPSVRLNLVAAGVSFGAVLLGWRRHWRLASNLLVWGTWVAAVTVVAATGGVQSSSVLAFPALLVMCAWVLGVRTTLAMLVLSVLAMAAFWVAGREGVDWIGQRETSPVFSMLYFVGMLGLTGTVTLMARRSLIRRAQELQDTLGSLEQHQDDLRKFYRAVEQNPESIVITDVHQNIVYVNEAFLQRTGFARNEVLGQPTHRYSTMGLDAPAWEEALHQLGRGALWRGQMTNRTRQGEDLPEAVLVAPIRASDGSIVNYVELKQDLSERMRAERQIHALAHFDALTGLPNRLSLTQRLRALAREFREGGKGGEPRHGLLLLDMDRFTAFNDVRGTVRGDALLGALALRLADALPDGVLLARMGADEFAVLLEKAGQEAAEVDQHMRALAQVLQDALERPLWLEETGEEVQASCSIGAASFAASRTDSGGHDVLRRAGVALHQAKQAGLGQVVIFQPDMAEAVGKRFRIEKDLRRAIPAGELQPYLQSQVDHMGRCVGAEVLVRWNHPRLGMVEPGDFIPVAEESDLIVQLGDWMLEQACRMLVRPEFVQQGWRLSVNVSWRQFRQPDVVDKLKRTLAATGADPRRLTLEVTESVVMRDVDEARERMAELQLLGVEMGLDDFGTGYSSLAYLQRLPFRELKIDKSFVQDCHTSPGNAAMVEAILLLARRLRLRVVAEGVETEEQAGTLRAWNQDVLFQGYHYGRPLPAVEWVDLQLGAPAGV
ncbi:GGDEF domain-containing protein [Delftia sp. HK171]|uniref:putative bifunctional diguanylate cyclase/phosphodiesterase n=1 Tax=Delftia TaxID=80865 RepID=UPI000903660E|nr:MULTISPECIES: GGDEF domain-containing phosphodiesterase [Delftia]APE48449.1 GGDEF domain-containing protein [Delftia sp. HK171]ATH16414.1 phosphodiesterase [Delftia acidovorans]